MQHDGKLKKGLLFIFEDALLDLYNLFMQTLTQ